MYNLTTMYSPDNKLGGVTLKSAGLVAADTSETAVEIGKGKYRIVLTWTACEVASNDELYNVVLEANTRNATSTYYKVAPLGAYGALEVTGDEADTPSTGTMEVIADNPLDYQMRVRTYVNGTIATGINFSVTAYPLGSKV